ncbi:MAG: PEP-utilizing enzyme [Elusimicrobiota bacterium]|jgi:hypothetical protein
MTASFLLILAAPWLWAQAELSSLPEPDADPVVYGTAVSLGAGHKVTARVTYDRSRALAGGCIFALPAMSAADAPAVRMSEGVLLGSGGSMSRAAVLARSLRIPAWVPEPARWHAGVLSVERPIFGRARKDSGVAYQVVERTQWSDVPEGSAVTLDPVRATLALHPADQAAAVLALAEALRAFDGMRDAQALVQWWQANRGEGPSGVSLAAESAQRLAEGTMKLEDFIRIRRAVAAALSEPQRRDLAAAQLRVLRQQSRALGRDLRQVRQAVAEAATARAMDRLLAQAQTRWTGLQALAQALDSGSEVKAVSGLWRELERAAAARRPGLASPAAVDGLSAVAEAVGAYLPQRVALDPGWAGRFWDENGWTGRIRELADDVSLPLSRRSRSIRELVLGRRLREDSILGRQIAQRLPAAEAYSVSSPYETSAALSRGEVLGGIQEVWAAAWDPGPLGARKRGGGDVLSLGPDADVITGTVFSRDPVSGRRERLVVLAASTGSVRTQDEYVLDRNSGRETAPAVRGGAGARLLSAQALARLVRAGRGLDDHEGRGMELDFAWAGGKLYLRACRPMVQAEAGGADAPVFSVAPQAATVPAVRSLR